MAEDEMVGWHHQLHGHEFAFGGTPVHHLRVAEDS